MKYYYELINGDGTIVANNDKKAMKFLLKKYGKNLLSVYNHKFELVFEKGCYAN